MPRVGAARATSCAIKGAQGLIVGFEVAAVCASSVLLSDTLGLALKLRMAHLVWGSASLGQQEHTHAVTAEHKLA